MSDIDLDSPAPAARPWNRRGFVSLLVVAALAVFGLFAFGPVLPAAHADTTPPVVALAGGGDHSARAVIQECQSDTQPDNSHDPSWVAGRQWLTDRDSQRGGGPGAWRDGSYRTTQCADGDITYISHGTEFNGTSSGCILIWFALQNPNTGNWSFSTVRSICSGGTIHLRTDAPVNWRLYVWMRAVSPPNQLTELPIGTLRY